jgi:phosphate-selective porin OprO and OprP
MEWTHLFYWLKICGTILFVLTLSDLNSQTELDERAFIEVGDAVSIKKDDDFLLNIRFRMQNRFGYFSKSSSDLSPDRFEAKVRRLRLRFDGYLIDSKLQYYIQLSFSRADQGLDGGSIAQIVRDAMVYYFINDDFYLGFGQGKLPGNRQRVTSSGSLQFADRSIVNATFNIDRDFGLFAYYTAFPGERELRFKAAISTGDGRNVPSTNDGLAYTGRLEWLPLGPFTKNGDFLEGDLFREPTPKISLGLGGSFNHKATKTDGQQGAGLYEERDIATLIADFLLKYRGWAFSAEYIDKHVSEPLFEDAPANFPGHMMTGYGINSQLSYLTPGYWEIAFRYAIVEPDSELSSFEAARDEVLLGLTRYFKGHRIKAQTHIGINNYRNVPTGLEGEFSDQWVWMFQLEFGI